MKVNDKVLHFICGTIAAVIGALVLGIAFGCSGYWAAFTCGVLCGGAAGVAAEVKDTLYHSWNFTFFDLLDLLATVAGGVLGGASGALITLVR